MEIGEEVEQRRLTKESCHSSGPSLDWSGRVFVLSPELFCRRRVLRLVATTHVAERSETEILPSVNPYRRSEPFGVSDWVVQTFLVYLDLPLFSFIPD